MGGQPVFKVMQIDPVAMALVNSNSQGQQAPTNDDITVTENPPPPVEQPAIPTWFWVVGGIGLFGAIGGVMWYVLK